MIVINRSFGAERHYERNAGRLRMSSSPSPPIFQIFWKMNKSPATG
jgi:hypothetical protein